MATRTRQITTTPVRPTRPPEKVEPPRRRRRWVRWLWLGLLIAVAAVALSLGVLIFSNTIGDGETAPTVPVTTIPEVIPPVDGGNGNTPIVPVTSSTSTSTTVPPIIPDNGLQCFVVPDKYCSLAQIQYDDDGKPIAIYWTPDDLPNGTSVFAFIDGHMLPPRFGDYDGEIPGITIGGVTVEPDIGVELIYQFVNVDSVPYEPDDFGLDEVEAGEVVGYMTEEIVDAELGANLVITANQYMIWDGVIQELVKRLE